MREAFAQCFTSCIDDVAGCIEIWLSDFEVNDVSSLSLQGSSANKYFEGGFSAKPLHTLRQLERA